MRAGFAEATASHTRTTAFFVCVVFALNDFPDHFYLGTSCAFSALPL
jgi:hypothetical protein